MASKAKKIENLSSEELDALLAKGDAMDLDEITTATQEDTGFLFEYMHACVTDNNPKRATEVFDTLKSVIDAQLDDPDSRDAALEHIMDWAMLAIRLVPEERNEFVCMPLYLELFETLADATGRHALKVTKARLQLLHHIEIWLSKGGNLSKLEEEDQELVTDIRENVLQEMEDALVICREQGYWDEALSFHRSAGRYYLLSKKVNEGIAQLKQAAEIMPNASGFDFMDQGDLYIEIGKIFLVHKKYPTAKKYFEMALDAYGQMTDADENITLKAEGWIEECEKFIRG